jgi:uncharacterized membrane protein YphA (DoxX/SURF4 family)
VTAPTTPEAPGTDMGTDTEERLQPWDRFFFAPTTTAAMTLVRVGWGALVTLWALSLIPDVDPHVTEGALRPENLHPGLWDLLSRTSWSGAPMAACLLLVVAGLATMVGYRTRLASACAVVCLIALERINPTVFNSGDLTLRLVGISVALSPCGLLWSLDARRDRRRGLTGPAPWRAPWALRLLQLHLAIGYFLSAWGKLRGNTWHEGTALGIALRIEDLQRIAAPDWLFRQDVLLNAITWGTLLFEVAFVFLVWNRRLRPWVLWAGVAFHLTIDLAMHVGFFSYTMVLAYATFLWPATADRIVGRWDPAGVSSADLGGAAAVVAAVEPAE